MQGQRNGQIAVWKGNLAECGLALTFSVLPATDEKNENSPKIAVNVFIVMLINGFN
jgi:hypothetical protein